MIWINKTFASQISVQDLKAKRDNHQVKAQYNNVKTTIKAKMPGSFRKRFMLERSSSNSPFRDDDNFANPLLLLNLFQRRMFDDLCHLHDISGFR